MSEYVDFLIVGGGISAMNLQLELDEQGHSTALIHTSEKNISTRIAAGIVNPVAGKFFSLTWRANDFFPDLQRHYQTLEDLLGAEFYVPKPIFRMLGSAGEQNTWMSKAHLPKYQGYCSFVNEQLEHSMHNFGLLKIEHGGHLDTNVFLNSALNYMRDRSIVRNAYFDHKELDTESKQYGDISFGQLVFCEGYDVQHNPFFKHLPITPNKGEVLEIETNDLDPHKILVGGVFVLPYGGNKYKVGASYDHFDLSLDPTKKAKEYLIQRFEKMLNIDYKITEHKVGIRPAVKDRRPLLGKHPKYEWMYVFNGLGSKGVSTAPQLAKDLVQHMLNNTELHPECDIQRFK